jgi:FKBP12-rapamycin complex-associated protein
MQLFGLVNTLLSKDPETFKRHLNITKYPVIPLSPNSGLIGWLENTDTLHVLVSWVERRARAEEPFSTKASVQIKGYRETRKILLNIEHRLMLQVILTVLEMCIALRCSMPGRIRRWLRTTIICA